MADLDPSDQRQRMTSIAFLGLGNMGGPMAANLAEAGLRVTGYDPVASPPAGVMPAANAAEAVANADVIITMLPDGRHVLAAYRDEVIRNARPNALLIDCSTIDVAAAHSAHAAARDAGLMSLDAPVSGGTAGAVAATLTFMVGGDEAAFVLAEPILARMGKRVIHCGTAGAGQAAKICNNLILGISMVGVCEAFALAERLGLPHRTLFDVASVSSGQCWALTTNCPVPGPVPTSPANRDYKPGFATALMLKDLRLAVTAADEMKLASPLTRHAVALYAAFSNDAGAGKDFSAIMESLRETHVGQHST